MIWDSTVLSQRWTKQNIFKPERLKIHNFCDYTLDFHVKWGFGPHCNAKLDISILYFTNLLQNKIEHVTELVS